MCSPNQTILNRFYFIIKNHYLCELKHNIKTFGRKLDALNHYQWNNGCMRCNPRHIHLHFTFIIHDTLLLLFLSTYINIGADKQFFTSVVETIYRRHQRLNIFQCKVIVEPYIAFFVNIFLTMFLQCKNPFNQGFMVVLFIQQITIGGPFGSNNSLFRDTLWHLNVERFFISIVKFGEKGTSLNGLRCV